MSRIIADGLSNKATATTQEAQDAVSGKYPDAAGVHAAFNQYGLDDELEFLGNIDVDTLTSTGFYYVGGGSTNLPNAATTFVQVFGSATAAGGDRVLQYAKSVVNDTSVYYRSSFDGVWSTWHKVFASNNVATTSENQAGSRNDVPTTPKGIKEYVDQFIGDVAPVIIGSVDDIEKSGIYTFRDVAGSTGTTPDNLNGLIIHSQYILSGFSTQFFIGVGSAAGYFYVRSQSSSVWSGWYKVFASNNVATTTENQNATRNDVPTTPKGIKEYVDQFGVGTTTTLTEVDADLYTTAGTFLTPGSGHVNFPPGDNSRAIITVGGGVNYLSQVVQQRVSPYRRFYRSEITSSISTAPWQEIFHSGNVATTSENQAATRNDVPTTPQGIRDYVKQFGIGEYGNTAPVTDLNNVTGRSGIFSISTSGVTNAPTANYSAATLIHKEYDSNAATQLFIGRISTEMFFRNRSAGTWGSWVKLATTGDILTYFAGNGISLSGTTFSVAAGDGLTQEASGLAVDATVVRDSDIGTNAERDVLIQTTEPTSGQGADGDICYVYTP